MEHVKTTGFYRLTEIIGDPKRGVPPIIPVGKSTWWQGCRTGKFPRPVKISRGVTVWPVAAIHAFIKEHSGGGDSLDALIAGIDLDSFDLTLPGGAGAPVMRRGAPRDGGRTILAVSGQKTKVRGVRTKKGEKK
jgi:hypothetical protein